MTFPIDITDVEYIVSKDIKAESYLTMYPYNEVKLIELGYKTYTTPEVENILMLPMNYNAMCKFFNYKSGSAFMDIIYN